ncbi:hypothetical protein IE077_001752, partial [Cardiosporidium cionae]
RSNHNYKSSRLENGISRCKHVTLLSMVVALPLLVYAAAITSCSTPLSGALWPTPDSAINSFNGCYSRHARCRSLSQKGTCMLGMLPSVMFSTTVLAWKTKKKPIFCCNFLSYPWSSGLGKAGNNQIKGDAAKRVSSDLRTISNLRALFIFNTGINLFAHDYMTIPKSNMFQYNLSNSVSAFLPSFRSISFRSQLWPHSSCRNSAQLCCRDLSKVYINGADTCFPIMNDREDSILKMKPPHFAYLKGMIPYNSRLRIFERKSRDLKIRTKLNPMPFTLLYSNSNENYSQDSLDDNGDSQDEDGGDESAFNGNSSDELLPEENPTTGQKLELPLSATHKDVPFKNVADAFDKLKRNHTDFLLTMGTDVGSSKRSLTFPNNAFFEAVVRLAPNELISRFVQSTPKRVQEAARTTVLGLLGTLPKFALETTVLTTGEKLANLMFQLQITGYMFKNAEYRMSLSDCFKFVIPPQSSIASPWFPGNIGAKQVTAISSQMWNTSSNTNSPKNTDDLTSNDSATPENSQIEHFESTNFPQKNVNKGASNISGRIYVQLTDGKTIEVDAAQLVGELRTQIRDLRTELENLTTSRENVKEIDLLSYIKSLPEVQMRSLTENISEDVIEAMRKLTSIVVEGLGAGKDFSGETITQQTGSVIAQLCMWQLAVGYNLRELEVREEIRRSFGDT